MNTDERNVLTMKRSATAINTCDDAETRLPSPRNPFTLTLPFGVVETEEEAQDALYKEDTLRGIYTVSENTDHEESKMDIELLFNAALCNRDKIKEIFSLKK